MKSRKRVQERGGSASGGRLSPDAVQRRAIRGLASPARRRGSIYILTLSTALIVSVLAMAALTRVRIQRRQTQDVSSGVQAQLHAEAAIQLALYHMRNTSGWRTSMANGNWASDQAIGDGFCSFTASDPTDNNLTDSIYDPVDIVGVGKSGEAIHKVKVRIEVTQPGIDCLASSMHAGANLEFDKVTANVDGTVSSNADTKSKNNAVVYADAEANNLVKEEGGGVFVGAKTEGTPVRTMPNPATVFSYYEANGTTINYSDLPNWDANLVENPGAEDSAVNTAPWYPIGCTATVSTIEVHSGARSFFISARNDLADVFAQDVTSQLRSGITYYAEAYGDSFTGNTNIRLTLKLVATVSGTTYVPLTGWTQISSYKKVAGSAVVSWTGTLTFAELFVECDEATPAFYIDDVILREDGVPNDVKVIHRKVLSPSSNPFGSGVTNPQGIYIIDCNNEKINVRDSRVSGCLYVKDAKGGSAIEGVVRIEPFQLSADPNTPNLPALMMNNKELDILCSTDDLDEGQINANLNPSGSPIEGSSDSDKADTWASGILGIIYSSDDFHVHGSCNVGGPIIAEKKIHLHGSDPAINVWTVTNNPLFYEVNAPPGFKADAVYSLSIDGYSQVVD